MRAPRLARTVRGIADPLAELPPVTTTHWITRRKAAVVAVVRDGLLTPEEACRRYQLSAEELASWQRLADRHGLPGLRATRIQEYRGPDIVVGRECPQQEAEPNTPTKLERQKRINAQEAERYQQQIDEFTSWQRLVDRHGLPGPRTTRIQTDRQTDPVVGAAKCPQRKAEPNTPAELERPKRINALDWNIDARYRH